MFHAAFPDLADADWRAAGATGIGNDDVGAPPTPIFRYGRVADTPFVSIHFGIACYTRNGRIRHVWVDEVLPASMLAAAVGLTLPHIALIPGLETVAVTAAWHPPHGGTTFDLEPA